MMMELARKAWVVSAVNRQKNFEPVEFLFFFVGHPTKQAAVDALRRNVRPGMKQRVRAEREMTAVEILEQGLRYRQVKYFARQAVVGNPMCTSALRQS